MWPKIRQHKCTNLCACSYLPGGHDKHTADPLLEYAPSGHAVGVAVPPGQNWPLGHWWHRWSPRPLYSPSMHVTAVVASGQAAPSGHCKHWAEPSGAYVPVQTRKIHEVVKHWLYTRTRHTLIQHTLQFFLTKITGQWDLGRITAGVALRAHCTFCIITLQGISAWLTCNSPMTWISTGIPWGAG